MISRAVLLGSLLAFVSTGTALGGGLHLSCRHHKCHCRQCCSCCDSKQDVRRTIEETPSRSLPMVLPIIETAPVFSTPVVYATQRSLVSPQLQNRVAVVRREEDQCACITNERFEKLETKVEDLSGSFADLRDVMLQQAKLLNEISKRLPPPNQPAPQN